MSEKITGNRFKSEIDNLIHQGVSSRTISSWLAQRGESISHVTISSYRKTRSENELAPQPLNKVTTKVSEAVLVQELRQKVVENLDNPSKLKIYLDGFLRMGDKAGSLPPEQIISSVDLKPDFEELRAGKHSDRLKQVIYGIFAMSHPYWRRDFKSLSPEARQSYREWQRVLTSVLEPLFEGKNPLKEQGTVKCKGKSVW